MKDSSTRALPLLLRVEGKRVVVVGGGAVGERKATAARAAGAEVLLIAPSLTPRLSEMAQEGLIVLLQREYEDGDLIGADVVFAATNSASTNRLIGEEARRLGALVNVSDDPESSDFSTPAVARSGEVEVYLSTGGGSPALARLVKSDIERLLGHEYDLLASLLRSIRPLVKARVRDDAERAALFEAIAHRDFLEILRSRDYLKADAKLGQLLGDHGIETTMTFSELARLR